MASILKVDKIRGTGLDSDTISLDGSGNITIPKNVTFSGTVSGGTLDILANNATGGSTVSEIVLDLSADTKYLYQRFVIENMFSSSAQDVFIRVRKASDNSYYSGANDYGFAYMYATSGGNGGSGNNDAANGRINGHAIGNANTETSMWTIDVYNNTASGTGKGTSFIWNRFGWHSSYYSVIETGSTTLRPSTIEPTNQFKIYPAVSGTLTYSGYVHYGIKRV